MCPYRFDMRIAVAGPSHHARHYRIWNTAFQQPGDCCVPKIVEPAPEWFRLFQFGNPDIQT
jgi:hypothetical protein